MATFVAQKRRLSENIIIWTLSFWTNEVVIWWLFNDDFREREREWEQEEKGTTNSAPYSPNGQDFFCRFLRPTDIATYLKLHILFKITYDIFLDTKQKVCAKNIFYKVRFCMRILIFTSFLSRWVWCIFHRLAVRHFCLKGSWVRRQTSFS